MGSKSSPCSAGQAWTGDRKLHWPGGQGACLWFMGPEYVCVYGSGGRENKERGICFSNSHKAFVVKATALKLNLPH